MMIDDDDVRRCGALVHVGDEAAAELRTLLPGAGLAPCVELLPQFSVIGQEVEFGAVARLGHFFPLAHLREPIDFVHPLQHRLAFHQVHLLPAEEIPAALHHRNFDFRCEVLLQEGNVLVEELLLQGLGCRGDHHAPPAADRREQVGQRLTRTRACFENGVMLVAKSIFDDFCHLELRPTKFVARVTFLEQPARAEYFGHGGRRGRDLTTSPRHSSTRGGRHPFGLVLGSSTRL